MDVCYFSDSKFLVTPDEIRSPNTGILNNSGKTGRLIFDWSCLTKRFNCFKCRFYLTPTFFRQGGQALEERGKFLLFLRL